jgi:hypothetical protein
MLPIVVIYISVGKLVMVDDRGTRECVLQNEHIVIRELLRAGSTLVFGGCECVRCGGDHID